MTLHDTNVVGGEGGSSGWGADGGSGVSLAGGELFASGGSVQGGDAGNTHDIFPPCGHGGTGLWVGAGSQLVVIDSGF